MPKISQVKKNQRKGQILHAAFQCFIRKGYEQTTMREIFDEAGLSAGAVYLYFKSKEDIMMSLAEAGKWHFKRIASEVDKDENQLKQLLEKLTYLIDKKGGDAGVKLEICLLAASLNDNKLKKILRDKLQHDIKLIEDLLKNSYKDISIDTEMLARMIIGTIQGLSIQKMLDSGISLQKILDNCNL